MTAVAIAPSAAELLRGVPHRKLEWPRAWNALKQLIADPERTDQVFEIVRALSGRTDIRVFKRLLRHPDGVALLVERPNLIAALSDRDALRRLPDGSLGRAYLAFMESAELTADGLVAASMEGEADAREGFSVEAGWFFDRLRDMHDVWHVLTGYGRDEAGEAANLAFTFGQIRNNGVGFIVLAAAVLGPRADRFQWQRYLYRAWRRGRTAAWLPAVRYEQVLEKPLAEVRRSLGIEPPEVAHPGGVVVASRADLSPGDKALVDRVFGQAAR